MVIALYARKSVERENSISCETQLDYCRAMLKPDERKEKILEFVDNGFSGGNPERDGFREMMAPEDTERDVREVIDLSREWKTADYEKKKSVVHLLIDKIYIAEDRAAEVVWNV